MRTWYNFFLSLSLPGKYEKALFGFLLVVLLWPIWANKYFLTLDGPSHLYNAFVLLQYWKGVDINFFSKYYLLNPNIDPNWFSHVVLAGLMNFMPPLLAEKIFLSGYILCYVLFSRFLIRLINKENSFLSLLPMLFVYSHVFQMGFYNFSFSMAWMILGWWFFMRYSKSLTPFLLIPVGSIIFLLTYISHPAGYILGLGTLALSSFIGTFEDGAPLRERLYVTFKQLVLLFISAIPSLLLLIYFFLRRTGYGINAGFDTPSTLFWGISHFTCIINLTYAEAPFAIATLYLMLVILLTALTTKVLWFNISRYDAFLIAFAALLVFYFKCPGGIAGAGIVSQRLQIIPMVVLPFWLASVSYPRWMRSAITIVATFLTILLMWIRIPVHAKCSTAVEECLSVNRFIPGRSTILPLSYAHGGKDESGKVITDATSLFFHSCDYLGVGKSQIMLGNYEGDTGYFPFIWRGQVNPFVYMNRLEWQPPCLDIDYYTTKTGAKIDYIITMCLDSQYIHHPCTEALLKQLDSSYSKIYTSNHGRAVLYRHKN